MSNLDKASLDGSEVKVGSATYVIRVKKKVRKGALLGQTLHHKETIELSYKQSDKCFLNTLLHEVLHCVWYAQGIDSVKDSVNFEEFVVNSITGALILVFQDNPWMLDLLKEA